MSSKRNDVSADRPPAPSVDAVNRLRRRIDAVRIREHLRRTEAALRDAEHDHLTNTQRRRRQRHLYRLAAYRRRGEFPTNRTETERTPLFVGSDGTPCAVAYLLLEAGREDLVESVQAADPTVRIEELPDEHPVVEWLEENGLTKAEAARIQPTYPEGVQFATTCGPVPCWLAGAFVTLVGSAVFAASEYVGYRLASEAFPDNALKRRGVLGYVTVLNLFLAPLLALVLFALFP
jgi:hypothetical protein